jgi:hypothetical protein
MAKTNGSVLNKVDYDEIDKRIRDAIDERLSNIPTKDEAMADKLEILAAINKKDENDAAHKMLHENLGEDVPKLQQQVQHLFKTFEIKDPTEVAVSI